MQVATEDNLVGSIRDMVDQELGLSFDNINMDTRLDSFEIDSLDVIKLALLLEKRWNVKKA